jgi:hypothetical protein
MEIQPPQHCFNSRIGNCSWQERWIGNHLGDSFGRDWQHKVGTGTLISLVVTPVSPTAAAGGSEQFVATGTFSDASTQDITLNAHWSSSHATVATIANAPSVGGQANCIAAGTTIIGSNSGGTTGSTTLTVQ